MVLTPWAFSEVEKQTILSLLKKGKEEEKRNDAFALFSFNDLYRLLDQEEIAVLEKFRTIDPKTLSYKLPFLGTEEPTDLTSLPGQKYFKDGIEHTVPTQYLPKITWEALEKLNVAIQKDLGKKLLVLYGYRSPARQVFIFFDILERVYDFDFSKTLERVCFPDYSEHVSPSHQAVDFMTQEGSKGVGFEQTEEYGWLKENAGKYGFVESYPQDNQLGMIWEPWHWKYVGKTL